MHARAIRYAFPVAALLLCAACADQAAPTQPLQAGQSSAPTSQPPQTTSSLYVWPTYLPDGMRLSPPESHVASTGEAAISHIGYYVLTLNGKAQKLFISGGDIKDTIPITGDKRDITIGERTGTLISNGIYREIVFNVAPGKLFVYSTGLSEEELLKVVGSFKAVDLPTLRGLIKS
jgi:hypothetical protein